MRKGTGGTLIFTDGREEMILHWREYDANVIWFETYSGYYLVERFKEPNVYYYYDPKTGDYIITNLIKDAIFEGEK